MNSALDTPVEDGAWSRSEGLRSLTEPSPSTERVLESAFGGGEPFERTTE